MGKTNKNLLDRDDTTRVVAYIHGVSPTYVKKVRSGERDNDEILATVIEYRLGKCNLIKYLEGLVPRKSELPHNNKNKKAK